MRSGRLASGSGPGNGVSLRLAQLCQKRPVFALEFFLQPQRAIAIAASPWFRAIFVAAVTPGVRVLDAEQVEIFFPVGPFFFQGGMAKTALDPADHTVLGYPGLLHVMQIFFASDRATAQCLGVNRLEQS